MKDYFENDFDAEDFNNDGNEEWLNKFKDLFNKDNSEFNWEADPIDDINEIQKMKEFEAEDLLDPDSQFSEIMRKLENIRFEKSMNDNFENLKTHGIDIMELKTKSKEDRRRVVETIKIMQHTFEEREEYEKCAILRPILNKIKLEIKL
jgi:hypothetical protein